MKYSFEKAEKSTIKLEIVLDKEDWTQAINTAYERTKGKYSVPGFRKGHVPKSVLESSYGKGLFYEDAINYAFPKYYEEILDKESSIEPVAAPEIDIKDLTDNGITMVAIVPVKPEIKLGDYKGITFDKVEYNVSDKDIEDELSRLQDRNSRMVEVKDEPCKDGDTVIIDYSGSVDGVKFEGGTAEKQSLTLGSKSFIPGFEEQVVGMNIGDEKDINVKFPEEYHAENLKGKDAVFAIKLHEIKRKELPEITDDFIKESTGAESLEAYKAETKERLEKQNAERAERELEDQMVRKITDASEMEIPDAMINGQIDQMVQDMSYRLSYQGLKIEDYLKYLGQTMDDFRKGYEEQAKSIVKSQLVIGKIIEDEKIEATEEDVEKRIEEMAKAQNKPVPDVKKLVNARQMDYVKNEIVIKKFFEFLKTSNTIK